GVVGPAGERVARLDVVFGRAVGDDAVAGAVPLRPQRLVIEQADVEAGPAAAADLLRREGDADRLRPAPPRPRHERPVAAADVQDGAAGAALDLVQQVLVLVRVGLLQWRARVA